ncbi:MAG: hypothetical protein GC182_09435 [Rhodopseudomonas sp.]|nr:hypothetical protein [Rhodopseudomonas sp.]
MNVNLTARREPLFHDEFDDDMSSGRHGGTYPSGASLPQGGSSASGLTRLVATVQIAGSLLAVPLGLASGYSIYRANFSPETTCQTLRTNIIGMLDKSVDPTTRRMLVRRDVESFERNCGSVDPDAHAAFKTLLAAPTLAGAPPLPKVRIISETPGAAQKPVARAEAKAEVKADAKPVAKAEIKTDNKTVARSDIKADTKVATKVVAKDPPKEPVKTAAKDEIAATLNAESRADSAADPEAAARAAAAADTRWLAAVRQALVAHDPELARGPATLQKASIEPARLAPVSRPEGAEANRAPRVILQPAWNVASPPVVPPTAPEPQARAPQNQAAVSDHPVPPAPIPVIAPLPIAPQAANPEAGRESNGSRLTSWIGQLPLVGHVIEPRGN